MKSLRGNARFYAWFSHLSFHFRLESFLGQKFMRETVLEQNSHIVTWIFTFKIATEIDLINCRYFLAGNQTLYFRKMNFIRWRTPEVVLESGELPFCRIITTIQKLRLPNNFWPLVSGQLEREWPGAIPVQNVERSLNFLRRFPYVRRLIFFSATGSFRGPRSTLLFHRRIAESQSTAWPELSYIQNFHLSWQAD